MVEFRANFDAIAAASHTDQEVAGSACHQFHFFAVVQGAVMMGRSLGAKVPPDQLHRYRTARFAVGHTTPLDSRR